MDLPALVGVLGEHSCQPADDYDAVQLREVARRARTSLATIYQRYANRDELILAALEFWMDEHHYAGLAEQTPAPGSLCTPA
ncbi:hypothetical protein MMRN_09490 [Mycobacterium marinum]|nr:hypothetical protein MMRN_09490 [Mycobacterium marinum]GJP10325.1 hypothetical protein NJB18001_40280 [Mycobacterium marinum]